MLSTRRLFLLIFVGLLNAQLGSSKVVPFLQQSFLFAWTPTGQVPPVPVTEQCDTINIQWSRSSATGPNPTAPYYLQVYTSAYTTPFIIAAGTGLSFEWQVPFSPGTQYQICMFDANGNTGGCQASYTMIPSSTGATCPNVTAPAPLGVEGLVINGPWSQYGWIDSCTDISIIPQNGTPPYTLTIAPSLHPPYNITSNNNQPMNWTVSLTWAMQFFVSVVDSTGLMWASGPLHSGGGQYSTTGCLSGQHANDSLIKQYIAYASGGGGLLLGLVVGALIAWLCLRRSKEKKPAMHLQGDNFGESMVRPAQLPGHDQYIPVPTTSSSRISHSLSRGGPGYGGLGYQVEPFSMPDEEGRGYSVHSQSHTSRYSGGVSMGQHHLTYAPEPSSPPPQNIMQPPQSTPASRPNQVYVVHHDSQSPPVTIYHQDGTNIVELPPRYPPASSSMNPDDLTVTEGRSSSDVRTETSRSNMPNSLSLHQARHVGTVNKPGSPK